MGTKFDIITHHFMLEFVDSDLYFVQDENNFINPLLQVESGSVEKSTGSGGSKIAGSGSSSLIYTTSTEVIYLRNQASGGCGQEDSLSRRPP